MLPAAARLRRRADFEDVLRNGHRASSPLLAVHVSEPAAQPPSERTTSDAERAVRVGFIVSRKVGTAVVRNRVQRQLRHILRHQLPMLREDAPGSRIVVRVAPRAAGASSAQLGTEFAAAWQRVWSRHR